jgi:hypothetical protein
VKNNSSFVPEPHVRFESGSDQEKRVFEKKFISEIDEEFSDPCLKNRCSFLSRIMLHHHRKKGQAGAANQQVKSPFISQGRETTH